MPIYEYVCNECGHLHEALQKFSDAPLTVCPTCNKDTLKKKISAPAFRLTGTGWYETDFKPDKKKNVATDGAKDDGGGKDDNKADDKKADDKAAGSDAKSASKTNGSGKEAAA